MISVVLTVKYGLFSTNYLQSRDFFVSGDIRTLRYDVEDAIQRRARSSA